MNEWGPDGPDHDMEASEIVSTSSTWFPERLTYILSNLSLLFPSLHTLDISFPDSIDCEDTFDVLLTGSPGDIEEDLYHHVFIKLLDFF